MVDYVDSSHLNLWLYRDSDEVRFCRAKANHEARKHLSSEQQQQSAPSSSSSKPAAQPVDQFACGASQKIQEGKLQRQDDLSSQGPLENAKGHPYLTPDEEAVLVDFYVSKLPSLIGPTAQVPRLRRESKVTATSALLLRRFFLSNSVMLHDPKTIMTSAAFLGSKVEDATADVRNVEEGTALMNAAVAQADIISGEITLLGGIHFDLLCFHPYKPVLAFTEDMRTYLKSDKGQNLVSGGAQDRPLSGGDLKPIYDKARALLDDVIVSDLPLLYNPGQIGLAALMVAQAVVDKEQPHLPRIDLEGYIRQRFADDKGVNADLFKGLDGLCQRLRELKDGKHGCGNYGCDLAKLKAIHKKLKKVRAWGIKEKKKSKRSGDEASGGDTKRQKTG